MFGAMSVRHPTISAWQRDAHEGHYTTEVAGFALRVRWSPNTRDARGSFRWTAERSGEKPHPSHDHYEELEEAMADAELFARYETARRALLPPAAPKH